MFGGQPQSSPRAACETSSTRGRTRVSSTEQNPPALPRDQVQNATLVRALNLATDQVTVNAGLKLELDKWKRVKMEIKQAFAVPISDSLREQISKKALAMVGMRAKTAKEEESKRRQFASTMCVNG
ncbi:hypothetical protein J3459_007335 [Metarhizium acridum]|uniref:uncharacterized protein n=1 Tax=Metarhizium acridum TaxID=92637 RepID=UPI001C6B3EB2|nr:hypothetical protein J3458_006927 [Metarhizium acridum]KAG8427300.1 hypothetical protein J3459_007335 [Metarhizium acridum]